MSECLTLGSSSREEANNNTNHQQKERNHKSHGKEVKIHGRGDHDVGRV